MGRVVVVGSLNTDHTVRVHRLPARGQTVIGTGYAVALGGKGANQAIAAARQGAEVVMVGCVGDDDGGDALVQALVDEGIDVGHVRRHAQLPTGRAHIVVDDSGRNTIVVVPGANGGAAFASAALEGADVLLAQLEVPLPVVSVALAAAHRAGVRTILNPAPARALSDALLTHVEFLVPNESEASRLGAVLFEGTAIITEGERGALVLQPGEPDRRVPPVLIEPVDSTAAGDAFCGTFAAGLARGASLPEALRRAAAAGALACTIAGAIASLPTQERVDELFAAAARQ
ncbi:MAG: ribokinase [Acidimicrobiales bacterium]